MGSCLYGILFCRQSESLPSHGMKHLLSFYPLITAVNIGSRISLRMSDKAVSAGGIRVHIEYVAFLRTGQVFMSFESLVFLPVFLPFFLDIGKIVIHNPIAGYLVCEIRKSLGICCKTA